MEKYLQTKILIIEDELITAKSIEKSLLDLDFMHVDIATDFQAGYEKAISTKPGLILMDIQLEHVGEPLNRIHDGVALSERVQVVLDVPVIYLTAHSDSETVSRALHTKPYGYLVKPYTDKELFDAIHNALNRFQILQDS